MAKAAKIWYKIKLHPFEFQNFINCPFFFIYLFINFNFQLAQLFKGRQVLFELFSLKVKREKEKFVVGCFRPPILVSNWDVSCFKGVTWWQEELYVKKSVVHVPSSFLMFPLLSPPRRLLKPHNKSEAKPKMSFNALLLPVHRKSDFGVTNKKYYGMSWLKDGKEEILWHVMVERW